MLLKSYMQSSVKRVIHQDTFPLQRHVFLNTALGFIHMSYLATSWFKVLQAGGNIFNNARARSVCKQCIWTVRPLYFTPLEICTCFPPS